MDNMVVQAEEKPAKAQATQNMAFRTSQESKQKLTEWIAKLGWKNGNFVDNVLAMLEKQGQNAVDAEFESEYNALIATHRRTEDMVAGIFARAVEFKAMAKEEADKKANDFIQTIGELQEAKKRLEETVKQLEKECEMATTRTAEAEARAKELSNSLEEKNAEITRIRVSAGDFSDVRAMLEKMLDTINRSGQK